MTQPLDRITEQLLDYAQKAGADGADALAISDVDQMIEVRGGALEKAERSEGIDIGLRVFVGKRQACVSSSDTRAETLLEMTQRAVAMAKEAPEDPHAAQAEAGTFATSYDLAPLEMADPSAPMSAATLQDMALRAEAAALSVEGINQVSTTSATYGTREIHLATSKGFRGGHLRTGTGCSTVPITGSGTNMERDYYGDQRIFAADMESPETIGRIAAERTLERAGARKPPTGHYPVLFAERISSSLIAHLLGAINGGSVARGATFLGRAMGTQILPDGFDVIEDPLAPRRTGTRPFDGEGLAKRPLTLVENGVLKSWVLDIATGNKLGLQSTGNAGRGTGGPPSPSVTNINVTQGSKTPEELMADMGTGLLVTSMIGSTINPTTGDYSRGASGFWIENGMPTYAVNECTIAGNLTQMYRSMIPSNDARLHLSRAVPSLLVEGLTIAGA